MSTLPETSQNPFNATAPSVVNFVRDLNTSWKMKLYFLTKLPSLLFWGVRIKNIDPYRSQVTIPFSWRSQNPFRSTYFAALAGAAELSTGMLASIALKGRGRISMLITGLEAQYTKKATSLVTFTCAEGQQILNTVQEAIDTGEGRAVTVTSIGHNAEGMEVAQFKFTWSFKVKKG